MAPPLPDNLWFPVAAGVTDLPEAPATSTATPAPANAIATPSGFDAANPDSIWTLLPTGEDPVFAATISPASLVPAVVEEVKAVALVRLRLLARSFPYALSAALQQLVVSIAVQISAVRVQLLAAAGATTAVTGQATTLRYTRAIKADAGSLATTGFGAGSIRDYRIGTNFGTFTATGQNAIVALQRAPLAADAGSFALTGQAALFSGATSFPAEAGSFALIGQGAGSVRNYVLSGATGAVAATGQDAVLNYVTPVFNILSYSGTNGTRSLTGLGFKPGIVWAKVLSGTNQNHVLFDNVRGATNAIYPNVSTNEAVLSAGLTSFDSDGFSCGNATVINGLSSYAYRAFCWKEGSAPATNNDGAIASTVSVNASAGFSIFTWSGTASQSTIGHGLGGTPDAVFIKNRTGTGYAPRFGSPLIGNDFYLSFDTTMARTSSTSWYRSASSTTVTVGSSINTSGTLVGYAFKSVPGISKFGAFTGDGSGTYTVDLGFTPRLVILKSYIGTSNWFMYYMGSGTTGYPNNVQVNSTAQANTTQTNVQFTSTGFTVAAGWTGNVTASASSAIYMAWA